MSDWESRADQDIYLMGRSVLALVWMCVGFGVLALLLSCFFGLWAMLYFTGLWGG